MTRDISFSLKAIGLVALLGILSSCAGFQRSTSAQRELQNFGFNNSLKNKDKKSDAPTEPSAPRVTQAKMTPEQEAKMNSEKAARNGRAMAEYHFTMAQAYSAQGQSEKAIEEYKLTLMYDPKSPLVNARLASEYLKKGMTTLAMESCREAIQHDPKMLDAHLMLAGLYSTVRENESALKEYEKVLEIDATNEEAAVYKAQIWVEQEQVNLAVQFLRTFVKKNEESAVAWYYLGRIEQKRGQNRLAESAYRKAMELRPSFTQAGLALGYLFEETNRTDQAITVYQSIFEETQESAAASRLATLFLKKEKYSEAVPYLEVVVGADPDDLNSQVKLGLVKMEMRDFDRAIQVFQGILKKHPEADRIHYYLGNIFEEQKKYSEAVAELKLINPESKLYPEAALHVAYILKNSSQVGEAKSHIQKAIQDSPRIAAFYLFQASLEEETKNFSSALRILEDAAQKFPEEEKLLYYLGSLYDRMGETDKSLIQMEQILRLNPQNADALNYIGYTWTLRGVRLQDAGKLLKKALALRPDSAYIQDSWGWYLFVSGRLSEAVVELEKAARLMPNEVSILEHLADAYAKSNLLQKAIFQYQEAQKFAGDEAQKGKLSQKIEVLTQQLDNRRQASGEPNRIPASTSSTP